MLSTAARALRQQSRSTHCLLQRAAFSAASKVREIQTEDEFKALLSKDAVVVDFTAVWCPPCKMIAPIFEEMASKHPNIEFVKIDIDNNSLTSVVVDHQITGVPTFVSYKNGSMGSRFSGADKTQLQSMIQSLLN